MVRNRLAGWRRRSNWRHIMLLCVAAAAMVGLSATALVPAPAAAAQLKASVFGSVVYVKRACETAPTGDFVPLPGAELVLTRSDAKPFVTQLSSTGTFSVPLSKIGGVGPVKGQVVLDGPRIEVSPDMTGDNPYRVTEGTGLLLEGSDNIIKIFQDAQAGAANIWTLLNQGASAAAAVSPVPIPKVIARWHHDVDLDPSIDDMGQGTGAVGDSIYVNGAGKRSDDWEPFVLLHEYGHHVLGTVADPGAGGDHVFNGVYPDTPALPWSEGFAHAFAAIVLNNPDETVSCGSLLIDMAAFPATPLPIKPRLAQYNEAAVAGVLWYLVLRLGNGNPLDGLKLLLRALHDFSYDGHPPESLRQVRDALIAGGLEQGSPAKHGLFDSVFAREKIGWGENVGVAFDDARADGSRAVWKIHLKLSGPYGTCEVTAADDSKPPVQKLGPYFGFSGWVGAKGDLPYTWQDDCLVNGGNDQANSQEPAMPTAQLWLAFPYLANEKHLDGDFTLTARYVCADATKGMAPSDSQYPMYACTPDRTVSVSVTTGVAPSVEVSSIDLKRIQDVPILTFDASGTCHFGVSPVDCSV